MPTATLITDSGDLFPDRVGDSTRGKRRTRWYKVDTGDPEEALSAVGLPRIGHALPGTGLLVVDRQAENWGPNYCRVEVVYESSGGGGTIAPPVAVTPGAPVTTAEVGSSVVTVRFPVDAAGQVVPGEPAINGGRGVPREVGTVDVTVRVAVPESLAATVPWLRLIRMARRQPTNADDVTLPRFGLTQYGFPAAPGTLRYRSFRVEPVNDLVVVAHKLALAEHHLVADEVEGVRGEAASIRLSRIFPSEPFGGLW